MRRLALPYLIVFLSALYLAGAQSFQDCITASATLADTLTKFTLPTEFKPDIWDGNIPTGRINFSGVAKPGDELSVRIAVPAARQVGGKTVYDGHSRFFYRPNGPHSEPVIEGNFGLSVQKIGDHYTFFLDRAFTDGAPGNQALPARLKLENGLEIGSARFGALQLLHAVMARNQIPRIDRFTASDVINFPTNLKLLYLELKWRKENPTYPKDKVLPPEVLRAHFQQTLIHKYVSGTLREAGLELDPTSIEFSGGSYYQVRDNLQDTDRNRRDNFDQSPSDAQWKRWRNNQQELKRFKDELAKTEPDIAALITDDTPMYRRYYVSYAVKP